MIPRPFLVCVDVASLVAAFVLAYWAAPVMQRVAVSIPPLHLGWRAALAIPVATTVMPAMSAMFWMLLAAAPAAVVAMELTGGYKQLSAQSKLRLVATCCLAPAIAMSFTALIVFTLKLWASSRIMVFAFGLFSALMLLGARGGLRAYKLRRLAAGAYARNIVVIGRRRGVNAIAAHFDAHVRPTRFRLVGWLDARSIFSPRQPDGGPEPKVACLGAVDDLGALLVYHTVHEVIAVQAANDREWLRDVAESCDYFRVRLRVVPEPLLDRRLRDLELSSTGDPLALPQVVFTPRHSESDLLFIKRMIDIVVSATALVLLAPVFAAIAVAIKITTPHLTVFYPWRVIGLKGEPFTGYKFTTMVADADERKESLMALNEMSGPVFKIKNDPRVTPLGRTLRKFSLNELPQLWSVLKGDMSLVGPRPAGPHELRRYDLWHKRKLCVQPGITCLWQVSGRNAIRDFDQWVRLDLEYIDNWSLWLDLRILARTAVAVFAGTGS